MSKATTSHDPITPSTAAPSGAPGARAVRNVAELAGRVMLAGLFLISGIGKIGSYAGTAGYMASQGVPGALLPAVIAVEVLGAAAIIAGWQTRITAFVLACFTLLAALIFHSNLGDQIQTIMFLKNVAIAGGFLLLVANGAGRLSIDGRAAGVESLTT